MGEEEKKIIIDEDWKAQVQREKEQAKAEQAAATKSGEAAEPEPEASFNGLLDSLAAQCMLALGVLVPKDADKVLVDLAQSKYLIDMMLVLRSKTKGNLTPEEEGRLTSTIAELQRAYVLRAQQAQEAALRNTAEKPHTVEKP